MEMVAHNKKAGRTRVSLRLPNDLARRLDRYCRKVRGLPVTKNALMTCILSRFLDSEVPPSELLEPKRKRKKKS
jgi:hypothetical protein